MLGSLLTLASREQENPGFSLIIWTNLGLKEAAGVTPPRHSSPHPQPQAQATHSHPLISTLGSLHTYTHWPNCPHTCTLGPAWQPEIRNLLCLHALHQPLHACALTAPPCTPGEGCVHTHRLVHSHAHFLAHFCLRNVLLV